MKTKLLYGILSVIVIALAVSLTGFLIESKAEPVVKKTEAKKIYVKTKKAVEQEVSTTMTYRGRVEAYDEVALAAEVTGRIMQGDVRFKTGQSFRKGDVLLYIYDEDVRAAMKSGKSSFLQILSQILPDIKVDYPDEYNKWYQFFQAVDPEKSLPALPAILSDKEKVFLAANNVLTNYYSLQQQEINLERYKIVAPFNGSFKQVNKEIGAVSSPGGELATLIRSDKQEVVVPVFPKDLNWIEEGSLVMMSDNQGEQVETVVGRISSYVDENTQSVNVYLTYNNNRSVKFLQGEYVDVYFNDITLQGIEIPREALVDQKYVYVLVGNTLQQEPVEVVRQLEDSYIITGMDASKNVVVESVTAVNSNVNYKSH